VTTPQSREAAHLEMTQELSAKITAQISQLLPGALTAEYEWPPASDVQRTMEQLAAMRLKRQELHCHADVVEALKKQTAMPEAERVLFGDDVARICGTNVFIDADLGPGEWQLREDGEIVSSGRLGT
jgi:hypothetical protein